MGIESRLHARYHAPKITVLRFAVWCYTHHTGLIFVRVARVLWHGNGTQREPIDGSLFFNATRIDPLRRTKRAGAREYGNGETDRQRGEHQAMDTTDTIRRIERELGMSQTSQVTTFEGIRERADGSVQEVTVEVLDAGEEAGARRYAVNLQLEDDGDDMEFEGEDTILGDPAATLDEALSDVSVRLE